MPSDGSFGKHALLSSGLLPQGSSPTFPWGGEGIILDASEAFGTAVLNCFRSSSSPRYGTWNVYKATNSWPDCGSNPPLLCTGVTWLAIFTSVADGLPRDHTDWRQSVGGGFDPYGIPLFEPPPTDWRQSVWSLGSPSATEVKIASQVTPVHKSGGFEPQSGQLFVALYTFHVPYLMLFQHGWHRHLGDDELLKQFSTAVPNASEASKIIPSPPQGKLIVSALITKYLYTYAREFHYLSLSSVILRSNHKCLQAETAILMSILAQLVIERVWQ
uniref:Fungal_trans domain-containing protein n=2 Tax=Heterorhabditis bacteriophora TaxID=37862 RepID=A0A1I7WVE5_HETBA